MSRVAIEHITRSPALDFVELRSANHSSNCYSSHSHDEFSFGVVDLGSAKYQNLTRRYTTYAGVTVTINPGDAHSCNPIVGDWSYRMLFVSSQWMGDLQRDIVPRQSDDYRPFKQHLLTDAASYQRFSQLFQTLLVETNPLMAEALLIEYCAPFFSGQVTSQQTVKPNLSSVRELIMDQLGCSLSLGEFSQLVDLSPFHLIRSFKQTYGQSPHAYQLDARIKRAKLMLRQGTSIAMTAHTLGFADQSHFQRCFKKRLALTPGRYQKFFVSDSRDVNISRI